MLNADETKRQLEEEAQITFGIYNHSVLPADYVLITKGDVTLALTRIQAQQIVERCLKYFGARRSKKNPNKPIEGVKPSAPEGLIMPRPVLIP